MRKLLLLISLLIVPAALAQAGGPARADSLVKLDGAWTMTLLMPSSPAGRSDASPDDAVPGLLTLTTTNGKIVGTLGDPEGTDVVTFSDVQRDGNVVTFKVSVETVLIVVALTFRLDDTVEGTISLAEGPNEKELKIKETRKRA